MNDADPIELLRVVRERVERAAAEDEPAPATVPRTVHEDAGEPTTDRQEPTEARRSALDHVQATGERRRRRRHSATRNAVEWVVVLAGALIVALVVKTWLFQAFYIPSSSMEPTLQVGDRVLVNKISYDLDDVDRGDIVVFERPESWGAGDIDDLIKRVIGLPGERIAVVDGVIQVDGATLDEPWLPEGVSTPGFFQESGCVPECTIPEGSLFVLGDNRGNSDASNHFGPLDFDQVVGRAFVRVWPVGDVGGL